MPPREREGSKVTKREGMELRTPKLLAEWEKKPLKPLSPELLESYRKIDPKYERIVLKEWEAEKVHRAEIRRKWSEHIALMEAYKHRPVAFLLRSIREWLVACT